ncbi:MAG: class I SAM-dependent methyltransferase [Verrucomicrobiaceae bacterium]|nr:class I SAM-dependent methyltransferase [Verrucomicrobiaceae bacterium]
MQTSLRDWYDTPHDYDIIFDADTAQEARFILDAYATYAHGQKGMPTVIEPACGSGRLLKALANEGCRVHGFDLSDAMVEYASHRVPEANVWKDRMESFNCPLKGYELAHCLVSTFKYLLTEVDARSHLMCVASHLRSGGIYVLGIHLTDYSNERCEHERWVGERDGRQVVCNTRTWPPDRRTRLEKIRTRLKITQNGRSELQETHWAFRTYNAKQVKDLIKKVSPDLELVACHDFQHDIRQTRELDDSYSDVVLILRRR